jgi:pSer/pThr/pTyr-binding forkhead associated (FHA) protein
MDCPYCGFGMQGTAKFCTQCGKRIAEIIKDQIKQEVQLSLSEVREESTHNTQSLTPPHISTKESNQDISYDTDDSGKIEYKNLLREVFADGRIAADEIVRLADKIKQLNLDKVEATNIQRDVAKEMGLDIDEEGDLTTSDIILEFNINKTYFAGEPNNLELRVTNITDVNLEKLSVYSHIMNLDLSAEKTIGTVKPTQKKIEFLPFSHPYRSKEIIELFVNYYDSKGNPSIYKSGIEVEVFNRGEQPKGQHSISVSIVAEKIMGSDLSKIANIGTEDSNGTDNLISKINKQSISGEAIPAKVSSYEEVKKEWRRLPVFLDEDETNKKRNELIINKKLKEGRDKLQEGVKLKTEADKLSAKLAMDMFKGSFNLLKEAKECYKKIMETDPEHAVAWESIKEIRAMISEIEGKIGILEKEPIKSPIKLTSGEFTVIEPHKNAEITQKKFHVYSKARISIGRDSKSDMVLRLVPYQPKEKYPENWQKSCQISGMHAEIINKAGQFYIRDTGSNNEGSSNGTFLEGKRLKPCQDYPLKDDMRINIARVIELECQFLGESKDKEKEQENTLSSCFTVLGEMTESCFGIDKRGVVDAIKFRRRNNYTDEEKYIILIRGITIGRSRSNGISVDSEKVADIHAKIFYRDNQYWIEDLNSRHGTWLNGSPVSPGTEVSLGKQSEILIGDATIKFMGFL